MQDQASDRSPDGYVICACCGKLIKDSKEENRVFGEEEPRSHDPRVGRCFECFGDPNAKDFRKQLGWAGQMFYDARIKIVRERLIEIAPSSMRCRTNGRSSLYSNSSSVAR